ncbi:MAG: hypothetical protein RLW62_21945 [Gammaproteobacteria bacterium]
MSTTATSARDATRRALRNFVSLLGGRAVGGGLALAATLISARQLGPEGFGLIALIHAYSLIVRGLVNVKPFEAIIRYGVPLLEHDERAGLGRLLRACLTIDCASAFAATVVGELGILLMTQGGLWPASFAPVAHGYCLLLLFMGQGTASGALRLFDRFDAISLALVLGNGLRLVGVVVVGFVFEPSVAAFAAVWAVSQVVQYLATQVLGWRVAFARLGATHLRGRAPLAALGREHPGIWHFMHVVYWQSTLDLVAKPLGTLFAGALLGAEGAALFRIAREFANVVAKPALLARQAIYPDLARLRHRGDAAFTRLILGAAVLLGVPALALTLASLWLGAPLLEFALGQDYVPAAGLLTWLVGGATLELAGAALRPASYTLGRARESLAVQVLGAVAFMLVFWLLTPRVGLVGPGIATVTLYAVMLAGTALVVRHALTSTPSGPEH